MTTKWRVYRIASLPERWVPDGYGMRSINRVELQVDGWDFDTRDEAVEYARENRDRRDGEEYAIFEVVV